MKLLITGGLGFMGSNFIRYILNKYPDNQIINIDKMTYAGNPDNLKDIESNPNYSFVKGNIANENDVEIAKGCDIIINFAAETHVDRSILDPKAFIMTDVVGTYNLLEATKKYGLKLMIQISTDEVYGSTTDGLFKEDTKFDPSSPYSASKAGADHLCNAYFRTFNTPVIITHSCNFIGPNQYPEKLIPLFITNLIEGKKVPVYGNGDQIREWIFTEDYCNAIETILNQGIAGETYNIGTGHRLKNIDVTKKLLALLGKDESSIEYVQDRPGHDFRYAIDNTKITSKLGWKPKFDFDTALSLTVDWYKQNESWWKKIKTGEFMAYYKKQYGK